MTAHLFMIVDQQLAFCCQHFLTACDSSPVEYDGLQKQIRPQFLQTAFKQFSRLYNNSKFQF